jgi:hypothetical protein
MTKRVITSFVVLSALYLGIGAAFEKDAFLYILNHKSFKEAEEKALKETIRMYNTIFTDLYATDGIPAMLNEFPASKKLKHELFKNIGALRNNKLLLVYDMATLDFRDIKMVSPVRAEVTAFEEWNYAYQKADTRLPTGQTKGMGQGFKYILFKRGQNWIIVDYYPVDSDANRQTEGEVSH